MQQIIPINDFGLFSDKRDTARVDSRYVAKMFGKTHQHVLRDIAKITESKSGLSEEFRRLNFERSSYKDSTGRKLPCYALTRDGFTLLTMGFTGAKAMKFKEAYIKRFNEMEAFIRTLVTTRKDFPLLTENIKLLTALKDEQEKRKAAEAHIEADKPKVLFADSVCASETSILVGEMAKLLKQNGIEIGEKRFFQYLRANGYLISRFGTDYNMPTQKSMELKIFEVKETSITHSSGTVTVSKTPKITGKGQKYFINKFLAEREAAGK